MSDKMKNSNTPDNQDEVFQSIKHAREPIGQEQIGETHELDFSTKQVKQSSNPIFHWIFSNPVRMIVTSFLLLILMGSLLLSLPIASRTGEWTNLLTSLFTSTSAVCVTGLVLVDTASYWSGFGHVIILTLIQLGGLGLLTVVASFFAISKRRMNFKYVRAVQDATGSEGFSDLYRIVRFVIAFTLSVELLGGLILSWRYTFYMPIGEAFVRGLFQGVSAFCNAGFDLLGTWSGPYSSLMAFSADPIILITTGLLITFGGLGFLVFLDLFMFPKTKKLLFHSKLVLIMTIGILVAGTIAFVLLEWNNNEAGSMGSMSTGEKILAGFFQTVTLRTAGFNSISQTHLRDSSKLLSTLIMLIGASPISTGGGMKTTTIAIVLAATKSTVMGEGETRILGHRIRRDLFTRALVIAMMSIVLLLTVSFILSITELDALNAGEFSTLDLIFESASALATVGVTSLQSENISLLGRIPLIISMFIGRIGPLSFALALAMHHHKQGKAELEVLPEGHTYVG